MAILSRSGRYIASRAGHHKRVERLEFCKTDTVAAIAVRRMSLAGDDGLEKLKSRKALIFRRH
jgi:hypothetical protein